MYISRCGAAPAPPRRESKVLSGIVKIDLWVVQDFVSEQAISKTPTGCDKGGGVWGEDKAPPKEDIFCRALR